MRIWIGVVLGTIIALTLGACRPASQEAKTATPNQRLAARVAAGTYQTAATIARHQRRTATAAGNFHFASPQMINVGAVGELHAVATGDIDGDGREDVIVATRFSGAGGVSRKVIVYRQSSQGSLLSPEQVDYLVSTQTPDVATGDFDRDGAADIVVGHLGGVTLVRYQPGQGYSTAVHEGRECMHIALLDADVDGALDVACEGEGFLTFHYGNGRGGFSRSGSISIGGVGWQDLKAADVTGDGLLDLVLFREDDKSQVRVYPHVRSGGFAASATYSLPDNEGGVGGGEVSPWGMAPGDFNDDGRTDLAISVTQLSAQFDVVPQSGSGKLLAPVTHYSATIPGELIAADFDGDGDDDLMIRYPSAAMFGYFPQIGGGLGSEISILLPSSSGGEPNNEIAVGDVNGDECRDVVFVDGYQLGILRGVDCKRKPRRTGGPAQVFQLD